jgi:hypothetical protein
VQVVYFLRAVECADGEWLCKRGRVELSLHPSLDDALEELHRLADDLGGELEIRVHPLVPPA